VAKHMHQRSCKVKWDKYFYQREYNFLLGICTNHSGT